MASVPAFAPYAVWRSDGLARRFVLLGTAFSFELLAVSLWLDGAALGQRQGLSGFIGAWGAWILRAVVGFAVFFLTFCWLRYRSALFGASHGPAESGPAECPVNLWFAGAHVVSISVFAVLSASLYGDTRPGPGSDPLAASWLAAGLCAIACGAFALVQPLVWLRIARTAGYLWIVAFIAVLVACIAGNASRSLWPRTARITFALTSVLLRPFLPNLIVDPAIMCIGTTRFLVEIAPECSGLEGIGLMLAFGATWLALFRRECRFPRALILLPAGAVLIFLLNGVRIAALILIGNAGAERIARGGFHSQAGWMAFNLVALGFTVASSRLPWIANPRTREPRTAATSIENPAAAWLVPFVAILAAGMISRALTGDFEWLYPLRFFAASAALVFFRRRYATLDWSIDWSAPAIGFVVFILWIGLDRIASPPPQAMPAALAAAAPWARNAWIAVRVLAAVVTVPVAEELAFRGFLYRRLLSADFASVSLRRFSWLAVLASSIVFGMLHGSRWFAGAVAGGCYALALLRRGRIGDAVAAHATTNALIAIDVLAFHQWQLW